MKKRYIEKLGMELSPLGFGVMRLPMTGDDFPKEVFHLMDRAMEAGINYYDTAYLYQKGKSEKLVKDALVKRYDRDRFYIADKLPVWECKNQEDMERIFQIQLERLGVDWIDFYLLHGLHEDTWEAAYKNGVLDFLEKKKREGKIRKTGFSFHDTAEVLQQIEKKYPWDFIQLQINYYDWERMGAKECYEYLVRKNIPCMVMEPVGGGRLSRLPEKAEKILKEVSPDRSVSSWAMRYVASLANAAVVLSGMSNEEQLEDNVRQFYDIRPLTEQESSSIRQVVEMICSYHVIPCSGCRYCMDVCPIGIDIPQIFKRYNDFCLFENEAKFGDGYYMFVSEGKRGDSCIKCGRCSKRCPQKIEVSQEIEKIHRIAASSSIGLQGEDLEFFLQHSSEKKVICFGAGQQGRQVKQMLQDSGCEVLYFCDNAENKWGTFVDGTEVISPARMKEFYEDGGISVLVTSIYYQEIKEQLDNMNVEYVSSGRNGWYL